MELLFDKIAAGEFKVLCNLGSGALQWDYDSGLSHLQQPYGVYWLGADGRIDFGRVAREVPKLVDGLKNDLLSIDVEGDEWWGLYPRTVDYAEWEKADREVKRLIAMLRRLLPGVKLGLFGSCPHAVSWDTNGRHANRKEWSIGEFWRRYLKVVEFMEFQRGMAEKLDFYAPSFYWNTEWTQVHNRTPYRRSQFTDRWGNVSPLFEHQQESSLRMWITSTIYALQLTRSMLPHKPLVPQISVQWWTGSEPGLFDQPRAGELVFPSWMPIALEAIRPHCDAVSIWVQPAPDGVGGFRTEEYLGSQGWKSIRDWAEGPLGKIELDMIPET